MKKGRGKNKIERKGNQEEKTRKKKEEKTAKQLNLPTYTRSACFQGLWSALMGPDNTMVNLK